MNPFYFLGFIYVTGNIEINTTSIIRGQIVGKDCIHISGTADTAEVGYDDEVMKYLMKNIGNYRISSAIISPYIAR